MEIPCFKYHPDPIKTGSIVKSDAICDCCAQKRGYEYKGSFYSVDSVDSLCPWCISSGEAADKYDGTFTSFGLHIPEYDDITESVFEEISSKTPGFSSFQEADWQFHCNDGCEFHGLATVGDFKKISEEEIERLQQVSYLSRTEIDELGQGDDSTTLDYFFKFVCRHCGEMKFLMDLD